MFELKKGLLHSGATGGSKANPRQSGRPSLDIKAFYRSLKLEPEMNTEDVDIKSNGLELVLEYNNTDFYRNPTRGSTQRLSLTHDCSWGNSTDTWTVGKAEAANISRSVQQKTSVRECWR